MKMHSDSDPDNRTRREQIIGLGEKSLKKSYYPQLQRQIDELNEIKDFQDQRTTALLNILEDLEAARLRIKESEEKYRQIVDTAHEGILVLDENLRISFVNNHMSFLLGCTIYELPGQQICKFIFEEDKPHFNELLESLKNGTPQTYETRFVNNKGNVLWTFVSATPLTDSKKHFTGILNMVTDISIRKQALEELRVSEERLRLALMAANQGLFDFDFFTGSITVSPEWETMLGYNPGELHVSLEMIINWLHPDDKEKTLSSFNACLKGKRSVLKSEYRMRTRTGDWKWILSSGKVIQFTNTGVPMRMIGTHTDITELKNYQEKIEKYANDILKINEELKRANRELEEANSQLKMLNEQKNEFVSLASHELRTPLISIIGFTQTLLSKDIHIDNEERERYLHIIESEGIRLSKLVTNLLDIARIEKKSAELNIEEFDIIELTKETINAMRIPPAISVSYQVNCSSLPKIHGDKEKLKQVYLNLLYNAIHHTGAGGKITVCIDMKNSEFLVAVQDTGSGIAEDDIPKIFDRFYRGKNNRSSKTKGSGLGLSISKEIIQAHGGTIWVKSKLGEGSTFFFTVPANCKTKTN